ncbi:MATE family efflux transporter [uncultured Faecalibaculum sp.]|uniref:MATE family efflux transporter n=1 Tax=uncultured Faecalibaculum sp. TaxID=1729681 RepID=UPI00261FD7C3|nr:MATE family efflux transporter [uncultured Faecalibaculum sp.]
MHKMESMDIRRLVISMSIPIALSMLLSALYNIIDSVFVAGYSQQALLAVSLCYPVQTLMIAIACGIGVGFNTVLARFLGEQKPDMASQSVLNGLFLALISWIIFLLFGLFGAKWFLGLFTQEAAVIEQGDAYLKICCGFSFAIFFQITYERIMQATGRPMYNLAIQGTGALINIILDPVFIFTFNQGVAGAAIATIIGQITAMGLGIWITHRKVPEIHTDIRKFRWNGALMLRILQIGIPAMVMQAVMSFMSVFMNWILMPYSSMAVSVFSVYIKLQQFVFMIVMGFTNALIPIVSFNFGARRKDRIFPAVRFSLLMATGIMLAGTVLFQLIPGPLLAMFNANQDMYAIGIPCLRIISLSFVFAGVSMILCSAFQALGHPGTSLGITLLRQLILLIPLTALLARLYGLDAGWLAFVITEVICAGLSVLEWCRVKKQVDVQLA